MHAGRPRLDVLLNEGPIAYIVVVFFAAGLLARPNGFRLSVIAGAALCCGGALVRLVPLLYGEEERHARGAAMLIPVHIGQTLNAAAAPFVVASVSQLSFAWFPPHERNTATAIANVASATGRAIGFGLGPALVKSADDLPLLLYIEAGLACLSVRRPRPARAAPPPQPPGCKVGAFPRVTARGAPGSMQPAVSA